MPQTFIDKVVLDLRDEPELTSYFNAKEPGETCIMEITARLDEVTGDQAVLSIKRVAPQGYTPKVEHDLPGDKGSPASPVMVIMGAASSDKEPQPHDRY
jgi:hypothetical protein